MPKSHKVKNGDTLIKLAIQYYGLPKYYTKIFAANPFIKNPDLIYPNQILTIPDLEPIATKSEQTDIPVTQHPEAENNDEPILSEEVSLEIDGTIFRFWENVDISLPFDSMRSFSLSAPFNADKSMYRTLFKPFTYKNCIVYVGGKKIITGTIVKISTRATANSRTLTVDGYSKPGILNDVNVSSNSWPVTFNGLTLEQIAKKLCEPFGVNVIFEEKTGSAFKKLDKIELDPDKPIFPFLIDLAKHRNMIIGDDENGNLIFMRATKEKAKFSIAEGRLPYISSDFSFDGQERFSDITIVHTSKRNKGIKYTVSDAEMKRNGINRSMTFKADDVDDGGVKDAAQSKLGRTLASSISGSIELLGWRNSNRKFLSPNQRFMFTSEGNMVYESTEFLIREVRLKKSPTSLTSSISVVLPDSYGTSQPERMPWE